MDQTNAIIRYILLFVNSMYLKSTVNGQRNDDFCMVMTFYYSSGE